MQYSVFSGEEEIGKAQVQQQGLYYHIRCRCKMTGAVRYKLLVRCGENNLDLGLCVPHTDGFGVDTKIPRKRLGEGTMTFYLTPWHAAGTFLPVSTDEPFGYIHQLQNARLAVRNGIVGIILDDRQNSMDKPTGQWSEPNTSE